MPTILTKGFMPLFLASDSRMITTAAAPSEIELEFAAVTVPSALNAGCNCGIFSIFNFVRSFIGINDGFNFPFTVTGVISALKTPI